MLWQIWARCWRCHCAAPACRKVVWFLPSVAAPATARVVRRSHAPEAAPAAPFRSTDVTERMQFLRRRGVRETDSPFPLKSGLQPFDSDPGLVARGRPIPSISEYSVIPVSEPPLFQRNLNETPFQLRL